MIRHNFRYLKFSIIVSMAVLTNCNVLAQGVSVSYLFPKNGYLSAPVSPFSIRGIGIGSNIGVETGATLYNIPGLAMTDLPFESSEPLTGPHFAILVPFQAFFRLSLKAFSVKIKAGTFGWLNLGTRINEGNMDRAWRSYEEWDILNTQFEIETDPGFGWTAGVELDIPINDKLSLTLGSQYLSGGSTTVLSGSYSGGTLDQLPITKTIENLKSEILLDGLEISAGVSF